MQALENPSERPALGFAETQAIGDRLAADEARARGSVIERPVGLALDAERGLYTYTLRGSLDTQDKRGKT